MYIVTWFLFPADGELLTYKNHFGRCISRWGWRGASVASLTEPNRRGERDQSGGPRALHGPQSASWAGCPAWGGALGAVHCCRKLQKVGFRFIFEQLLCASLCWCGGSSSHLLLTLSLPPPHLFHQLSGHFPNHASGRRLADPTPVGCQSPFLYTHSPTATSPRGCAQQ